MAEDETTQTEVEEPTTQTGEQEQIGEAGAADAGTESGTTESESPDFQKKYEDGNRKITAQGQELATLRQQNEQQAALLARTQEAVQTLGGAVRARENPVEAAWQRYQQAQADFNQEDQNRALLEWKQASDLQLREQVRSDGVRAAQLQAEMPRATEMLGMTDQNAASQRLAEIHQSLTPAELAIVGAHRAGTLQEQMTKQQASREAAAQQAELLNSVLTGGGGHRVPGLHELQAPQQRYDLDNFMLLNRDTQQQIIKAGIEIVDMDGEVMANPPLK